MLKINFNEHPEILKYIPKAADSYYMKENTLTILDNETFINVVSKWIKKFEKDIDIMVENTLAVYKLTNEQTGHQALSVQWSRWSGKHEQRFSKELVRQWWEEKFGACICHLYQAWISKEGKEYRGGATGCMITCSFCVRLLDSDLKSVKYNVVSDFNMSLDITNTQHDEIDMYDM